MSFTDLNIPPSQANVSVKLFNLIAPADRTNVKCNAASFIKPVLPGHENFAVPVFAFLVEHGAGAAKTRVMFDLGVRKDVENAVPFIATAAKAGTMRFPVEKDIIEQLTESGVGLESIRAVIWSHSHMDHTGDISKFPASTNLVVSKDMSLETHETNPHSMLLPSDVTGRRIITIDFDATPLEIGGMKAFDYFGDGSFYILNAPGHQAGHVCALARVTPTSFVFMGGDACHHPGVLRPTLQLHKTCPCPGAIASAARAAVSHAHFATPGTNAAAEFDITARTTPLLSIAEDGYFEDPPAAHKSIEKMGDFDANPDVFVILAHDESLVPLIGPAPVLLDDWKAKGWKEEATWAFLNETSPAFRFNEKRTEI